MHLIQFKPEEIDKVWPLVKDRIQEALNRPVIFIRFNPDAYNKNKSCFKLLKKLGFTTIPKDQEQEWKNRLQTLKTTILENINNITFEPITIIKLYYDAQ
jgi:hypothetical protein